MIVRLQTRCGCVRLLEVNSKWIDETLEVAMMPSLGFMMNRNGADTEMGLIIRKRKFVLHGTDADGMFIYLEELI